MMDKKKRTIKVFISTYLFSLLGVFINYAISFSLTPLITTKLSTEAYGFVSLAKNISDYGIIFTSCLNAYAARYVTLAYHNEDKEKANIYYSSVVLANIALLILVLLFELVFVKKIPTLFKVPNELSLDVQILFALELFNYFFLAWGNTFTIAAYVKNKLNFVEFIKFLSVSVELVVLLGLFLFLKPKVYYVAIALLCSTTLLFGLNYILSKRTLPELVVKKTYFSWAAVKDLLLSGIWNSLNSIGNMLNTGLDLLVSDLLLTPLAMGQLSIVKTMSVIFSSIVTIMGKPFQPILLNAYARKQEKIVVDTLKLEMCIAGYVSNMLFAGVLVYGRLYYRLWTPNQNISLLAALTVVTGVGFVFEGVVHPLFYVYTLTLKNMVPCFVTIISGILNVSGMFLLLKYTKIGLYGVVGTTTVLAFFTFYIFTPLYASYCLKMKWSIFYSTLIRNIISAIILTLVVYGVSVVINAYSWITLIFSAILAGVIALPVHLICVAGLMNLKAMIQEKNK